MTVYDNVVPKEKWEFDEEVAEVFENMLERSIPQYHVMRNSVVELTKSILLNTKRLKDRWDILDIGCSDGLMLEKLIDALDGQGHFVGVDISEPMLKKAKDRFSNRPISSNVDIKYCDLRTEFPEFESVYDVITSILCIQFTPIECRQQIIQNVYDNLSGRNGTFIMVEKVLGNSAYLDKLFVSNYYNLKRSNGYSQEQIDRKRLSLEGVLVPVTSDWNIQLLKQAGFRKVDVFWRWMNFVGYIAVK